MLRVHQSAVTVGSLGVLGLHAAHGRGVKVFQISGALTIPTVDSGRVTDVATNFALAVDGAAGLEFSDWGFTVGLVSGANTLKQVCGRFSNGIIVQDLEITGFTPVTAAWRILYEDIA